MHTSSRRLGSGAVGAVLCALMAFRCSSGPAASSGGGPTGVTSTLGSGGSGGGTQGNGSSGSGGATGESGKADAGGATDAGSETDADAGSTTDAGAETDAGGVTDAGAEDDGGGSVTCPHAPTATTQHLATGVHDPSMIRAGSRWYLFGTGGNLGIRSSPDMVQYTRAGSIFVSVPAWVNTQLGQTITELWAPDVSYANGTYRVYYAGSVFGSKHSVIGLATNTTLDSSSSSYQWVDQGLVIESNAAGTTDNWNAIDPNTAVDAAGNPWLVFGSFWSGIKMRLLDVTTGKLSTADSTLYSVASRPDAGGAIEAPSIVAHNDYYYLFVSFDACCKGVNSTYRTMVGRSKTITGPYTDRTGQAMTEGFAEQLLATEGRYIGPGGGTAFRDCDNYYYAYHYYDGKANGAPLLEVRPITWTADDWPSLGTALWQ